MLNVTKIFRKKVDYFYDLRIEKDFLNKIVKS